MFRICNNFIQYFEDDRRQYEIRKDNYIDILNYLKTGKKNAYIEQIEESGMKDKLFHDTNRLVKAMKLSLRHVDLSLPVPNSFNIELTTRCPLRCPQCYCYLQGGKNIDLNVACEYIKEAGHLGVNYVNLSGGETLAYPHLKEIISCCRDNNILASIAISGWNFTKECLDELINSGIDKIYVSLNGSTKEVNEMSRDGYEYALNALSILKESNFNRYFINWVAHKSNICDFENLVSLAKDYDVKGICILSAKPDSKNEMSTKPSIEQFKMLGDYIKNYSETKPQITIENCYSSLAFYVYGDSIVRSQCMAGKMNFSISVNGLFTPCRHIEYEEQFDSIQDYWENSEFLHQLRRSTLDVREPCLSCKYSEKCMPCLAMHYKMEHEMYKGNDFCYVNK